MFRNAGRSLFLTLVSSFSMFAVLVACSPTAAVAAGLAVADLPGVVLDDESAERVGEWMTSSHVPPYAATGYLHDDNAGKGEKSVRYSWDVSKTDDYEIRLLFAPGKNRASNVPVEIQSAEGKKTVIVNQRVTPSGGAFFSLGKYRLAQGTKAVVVISNKGTNGYVIADAVQFLSPAQQVIAKKNPLVVKNPVAAKKPTKKPAAVKKDAKPSPEITAALTRPERKPVYLLTSEKLDKLLDGELGEAKTAPPISDELFLRRATLDVIGRPPTVEEMDAFLGDSQRDRTAVIDRLLAGPGFGVNWGNYWSDVISHRVPQPELTFLNYKPLKAHLAGKFNANDPWDKTVTDLITATGKVGDNPAASFVGFHQASVPRLAGETTRVFLSVQIQCAQCHDDPFQDWEQQQFHQMAAFYARVKAKLPHNNSDGVVVSASDKGEHKMPQGGEMKPVSLTGTAFKLGVSDQHRRALLAAWVTSYENPWFAKSFVNRAWSRMLGRGFCEPVDNIYSSDPAAPKTFDALAKHFVASNHDVKDVFRLILNSKAYFRGLPMESEHRTTPFAAAVPQRIRGDEVFDSLATVLQLPNVAGKQKKAAGDFRFPPPPKSTRDLVNDSFGFDPSIEAWQVERTLQQAIWMMNNDQLLKQIDADPKSETVLSKILAAHPEDDSAVGALFRAVLGRKPTDKETALGVKHVASLDDRGEGFEDLLWSLVNTAEFTTRR
ncbi:MAG: DUF1549 domain-containing protein [Planctomycetales bacterium]